MLFRTFFGVTFSGEERTAWRGGWALAQARKDAFLLAFLGTAALHAASGDDQN